LPKIYCNPAFILFPDKLAFSHHFQLNIKQRLIQAATGARRCFQLPIDFSRERVFLAKMLPEVMMHQSIKDH